MGYEIEPLAAAQAKAA